MIKPARVQSNKQGSWAHPSLILLPDRTGTVHTQYTHTGTFLPPANRRTCRCTRRCTQMHVMISNDISRAHPHATAGQR